MRSAPLVVFSHLRWDFVFQRPQHVMSRLAARRPVLYIEEPIAVDDEPSLEITTYSQNLRVVQPRLRDVHSPTGFVTHQIVLGKLLRELLERDGWQNPIAWLYTPMAVGLAKSLRPRAIAYDCMDELSAFLNAPAELIEKEQELLGIADIVMTGGPSLYRAKREKHANVHCFPSSVDVAHFEQALRAQEPDDQRRLPAPRLGYFGVIDERMDLEVIDAVAAAHPEWQVVMVGPVVKIDPADLPRRPNLHFLGSREYAALPAYATGWDVSLIPFAISEATRFLSPTKTLEYMAAGRPIVSTPITDVVEPYGDIVYVGDGPAQFVAACEAVFAAAPAELKRRRALAQSVLRKTSWDETVRRMDENLRYLADSGRPTEKPRWVAALQTARA